MSDFFISFLQVGQGYDKNIFGRTSFHKSFEQLFEQLCFLTFNFVVNKMKISLFMKNKISCF